MGKLNVTYVGIQDIIPYENNPRRNEEAVPVVAESIKQFGFRNPIILDKENVIVAGHTRYEAAKALGMTEVPVIYADDLSEEQVRKFRLVDNKTAEFAGWDFSKLEEELAELDFSDFDFGFFADDATSAIDEVEEIDRAGNLAKKFLVPPFSVLYGNKGDWLNRKKIWLEMGIKSEIGRGGTCVSASRMDGETVIDDEGCINGNDVQNRRND